MDSKRWEFADDREEVNVDLIVVVRQTRSEMGSIHCTL